MLGLAVGDALGRPVVFESPARIVAQYGSVEGMLGGGTWDRPPGTVTDETTTALRVARSLVQQGQFDPSDVAARLVDWFAGDPFDVDATTAAAVGRLRDGEQWHQAGRLVFRHGAGAGGRRAGIARDGSVGRGRSTHGGETVPGETGGADSSFDDDSPFDDDSAFDDDSIFARGSIFDDEPIFRGEAGALDGGSSGGRPTGGPSVDGAGTPRTRGRGNGAPAALGGGAAASGAVPRAVPLALAFREETYRLASLARTVSRITHADPRSTAAAALVALVVAGYLCGVSAPLARARRLVDAPPRLLTATAPLVGDVPAGPTVRPDTPVRRETAVATVCAALRHAMGAASPADALLAAVNEGGNADTVCAICGAVAGARFGASAFPERWLSAVEHAEELRALADALFDGAATRPPASLADRPSV